jgi:hypothetical protein
VADTDALLFPPSTNVQTVSYSTAGVGWSFAVATNIAVTQVGFWGSTNSTGWQLAGVAIWASTNKPLATYAFRDLASKAKTDTNGVTYAPIAPLGLEAGEQYYITMYRPDGVAFEIRSTDPSAKDFRPFAPAPGLTFGHNYDYDAASGTFAPKLAGGMVALGPTFQFQIRPKLEILPVARAIALAWPTNAAGFALQTSPGLSGGNWAEVTNTPALSGSFYVLTNVWNDRVRFFRLKLR